MFVGYCLSALVVLATLPSPTLSSIASPAPYTEVQPDGTVITLFGRGDDDFNWQEDTKGFTVVEVDDAATSGNLNGKRPRYMYATVDTATDTLTPSAHEVGKVNPAAVGLQKRALPTHRGRGPHEDNFTSKGQNGKHRQQRRTARARRQAPSGSIRNLVVMVRFAGHATRPLPTKEQLEVLFNNNGADATFCPTGSVRDVWSQNSYGQVNITSTLTGWIDVPQTEYYSANRLSGKSYVLHYALTSALQLADESVDFSQFDQDGNGYVDMLTFVHSGYAAEHSGTDMYGATSMNRIWSHQSTLTDPYISAEGTTAEAYVTSSSVWGLAQANISHVGAFAHEIGHLFGLPDLYDTVGDLGSGLGSWDLMANSWGFTGNQMYPPHLSAWSKAFLNFVQPTLITASGDYTVLASETNPSVYKITAGFPAGEYLLIENREAVGFDAQIPGTGGLAIYHIDESAADWYTQGWPAQAGWPTNGNHYRVALLQADGLYQLESVYTGVAGDAGDLYRVGGPAVTLSSSTVPNTNTYQNGIVASTGISITVTSAPGMAMTFHVDVASQCSYSPAGTACDDNNASTMNDVCSNGQCVGTPTTCGNSFAPAQTCTASPNLYVSTSTPCTGATCNAATCCRSLCQVSPVGTACNDNNLATVNDVCVTGGVCAGVQATCGNQNIACPAGFTAKAASTTCTPTQTCNQATCCIAPPTLKPTAITITRLTVGKAFGYQATVTVVDTVTNAKLGTATVKGIFTGSGWSEARSGITAATGIATIATTKTTTKADATTKFCVTSITRTGYATYTAVC